MEVLGYFMALLIGVSLGMIGGGGSILTVPVFVYIMHINPVLATAYSLFVVGLTALIGGYQSIRKGLVSLKTAVVFSIPAFIAVYVTRLLILPALPEIWLQAESYSISKGSGIMLLFAVLMMAAAYSMIKGRKEIKQEQVIIPKFNFLLITAEGLFVGFLTGLVGAGGGFLIIPALVLLAKLPMKTAVGTSLLIIAAKSLIGFTGDLQGDQIMNWPFLLTFTSFSIGGIFLGSYLSNFVDGNKLKKGFGWFTLIMSTYILAKEIYQLN